MPLPELTPTQRAVVMFIRDCLCRHGRPPTHRELCDHFGWKSDNAARQHLRLLEKKGVLDRGQGMARGVQLAPSLRPAEVKEIPVVGQVAAGLPIEAIETSDERIGVDARLFPEDGIFALRVRGDSMTGVGIREGDLAIVHRQDTAEDGQVVVAVVNGEATVKRYHRERGKIVLKAENPDYADISVGSKDEVRIVGVVVGIVRRL